jgi:acyl-CoA thioesterase YciA
MPSDTNPAGDIFGGWLLSRMDIAGSMVSKRIADNRTVTIAINSMEFIQPVFVGDILSCYVTVKKIGNTSISTHVEAWVSRQFSDEEILATEGDFTYVAVDDNRKSVSVRKNKAEQ